MKNEEHSIWPHHFKANEWGNNGNSDTLHFLGSEMTADGDYSHEIKRWLLFGRKAMTNLDLIFPGGSDGNASAYNIGDLGLIPGSGRFPGEGNGNPLQYSCLENPMDGEAWCPWGREESDTTERLHSLTWTVSLLCGHCSFLLGPSVHRFCLSPSSVSVGYGA